MKESLVASRESRGEEVAVVLLSGGLDSATVLAVARSRGFVCHAMSFDYGQRHRHELAAAARVAALLGAVRHVVVPLDLRAFGGSALTADIDVPKGRGESEMAAGGIPVTYVPGRNMVFLSLAAGYAEVIGSRDLFIGVNAVDYSGYPDCRPEFVESMERTINLATKAGVEGEEQRKQNAEGSKLKSEAGKQEAPSSAAAEKRGDGRELIDFRLPSASLPSARSPAEPGEGGGAFKIHAPIISMTKGEIIREGVRLGVDYGLTHSCYDPVLRGGVVLACGGCDSCVIRRSGFAAAGVADPTRYA